MRILLTGAKGPAGRALLTQLRHTSHEIVCADMLAIADEDVTSYVVPPADSLDLLPTLLRIVEQENIHLVIPTVSEELPQVAAAAPRFRELGAQVVVGSLGPVSAAHDKLYTAWTLAEQHVSVPFHAQGGDLAALKQFSEALGGPFVVKPRVSRGGRGVVVIDDLESAENTVIGPDQILQAFMPGVEYAPVVHISASGDALCVVLEKTELAAGRVGNATAVKVAEDAQDVADVAIAAVKALGLTGPVDLDVRRDTDGTPRVLEINARFGANSASAPELLLTVLREATVLRDAEQAV